MSECPPTIQQSSDPAIIYICHELQRMWDLLHSPAHITNILNRTENVTRRSGGSNPTPAIKGDNTWISVTKQGNKLVVSHIGPPNAPPTSFVVPPVSSLEVKEIDGTSYLWLTQHDFNLDAHGHVQNNEGNNPVSQRNIELHWIDVLTGADKTQDTSSGTLDFTKSGVLVFNTRAATTVTIPIKQVKVMVHEDDVDTAKFGVYINDSDRTIHVRTRKLWVIDPPEPALTSNPDDHTVYGPGAVCP